MNLIGTRLGTDPAPRVVCVCGLAIEARIARAAGFSVVVAAGDRDRAAALVAAAAAQTTCLVSFGIAGGLAPELRAGALIVSGEVVSAERRWVVEPQYMQRLSNFARSIGAIQGPVLGASSLLGTRSEKERAWAVTHALAVDLESGIVASTAMALGIPFVVLRSIADSSNRDLPPAALVRLRAGGKPDLSGVLAAILRRPLQVAAMMGLARETGTALSALVGAARALRSLVTIA